MRIRWFEVLHRDEAKTQSRLNYRNGLSGYTNSDIAYRSWAEFPHVHHHQDGIF
jgi:hypothetical protein